MARETQKTCTHDCIQTSITMWGCVRVHASMHLCTAYSALLALQSSSKGMHSTPQSNQSSMPHLLSQLPASKSHPTNSTQSNTTLPSLVLHHPQTTTPTPFRSHLTINGQSLLNSSIQNVHLIEWLQHWPQHDASIRYPTPRSSTLTFRL